MSVDKCENSRICGKHFSTLQYNQDFRFELCGIKRGNNYRNLKEDATADQHLPATLLNGSMQFETKSSRVVRLERRGLKRLAQEILDNDENEAPAKRRARHSIALCSTAPPVAQHYYFSPLDHLCNKVTGEPLQPTSGPLPTSSNELPKKTTYALPLKPACKRLPEPTISPLPVPSLEHLSGQPLTPIPGPSNEPLPEPSQ
ncbi:uncharacterized protein LOC108666703 [Hyalella azteca]|uniref:Uncharacterized protein LOC108666703 n=1 Tax=Hyalella azteca TaxID=294128 RepID=A0A8B7N753_HYAAZ|nr:uncharacterized protein LOC108666703 [Hyalella azteca]